MNTATQEHCLNLLAAMPSSSPWMEASAALYIMAMEGWTDDVAMGSVRHAAMNLKWRPAPVELREIAVALFAPAPGPMTVREQLREMLLWHGKGAARYADQLPLLASVADELGGWASLSRMTTEDIDAQFTGAYSRAVKDWTAQAAEGILRREARERVAALAAGIGDIRKLGRRETVLIDQRPGVSQGRGLSHAGSDISALRIFEGAAGKARREEAASQ